MNHTKCVCKHVFTGNSNTDVDQDSLFLPKNCVLTRSAESDIFCHYSQLEEPSNYSASIVCIDIAKCKSLFFKIACKAQHYAIIKAQVKAF